MENRKTISRILIVLICVICVGLLGVYAAYRSWERPPEISPAPELSPSPEPSASSEPPDLPETVPGEEPEAENRPSPEPLPEGSALDSAPERRPGIYTILLAGLDLVSNSTDVIAVGRIDTVNHEINIVNIPRDSIINVNWDIRKINAVYAGSKNFGGTGIDSLTMHVQRYIGFRPDCYAILNLHTFIDVIDELGGVDFDVPWEIGYFYDDIELRKYIHLNPGPQHLDGLQAMALCRYRESYTDGDVARIEVQHAFLKACAEQFISLGGLPHARRVVSLLAENLETDLSAANIAWLLRQGLACKSEDIHFYTMPADHRLIQGYSYELARIWEWIEMINEKLNPFDMEIGYGSLDVVYCDGMNDYSATSGGLDGAWYYGYYG